MNFDIPISREGTFSEKYELRQKKFGTTDVLPLWVADMDLATSEAIQEALLNRIHHPIYGYTGYHEGYFEAIQSWMLNAHGWEIQKEWITPISSIVSALNLSVEVLSKKEDGVIIQPPIYPPFYGAVKKQKRTLLENKLHLTHGRYEIDFKDFEAQAKQAKVFLFCSPHNPTGRVWVKWELEKLAKICKDNGVIIISDEVHGDLVHDGYRHIPIGSLEDAKEITITLNAPSKTFNVAGIVTAYAITPNSSLRRRFAEIFQRYYLSEPSLISQTATIAAYGQSHIWLREIKDYLRANLDYLYRRLRTMAHIKPIKMQATFLLWLDCTALGMDDNALHQWFIQCAGLGLNPGESFGKGGTGFMRLNFAVSKRVLEQAMDQLQKAYDDTLS